MKKSLLVMAMVVAGVGTLAADTALPPQLNLNLDGSIGVRTEPTNQSGHGIGGASGGFEYIPAWLGSSLGADVDFNYLAVGKPSWARDNDVDLSLRGFAPNWGPVTGWLQGGVGYNTSENVDSGHWLAFVGPGVRWVLFPRLAVDGGVRYLVTTPDTAFRQSFSLTLGLSIPLDTDYIMPSRGN